MYTRSVELTATNLRKDLFKVLDRALHGESIEIVYNKTCAWQKAP